MSDYFQGSKIRMKAEDLREILSRCQDDCTIVIIDYREIAETQSYLNDHMISVDGRELLLYLGEV